MKLPSAFTAATAIAIVADNNVEVNLELFRLRFTMTKPTRKPSNDRPKPAYTSPGIHEDIGPT